MVGIIAFPQRRCSHYIESETRFPDPVGIQEIQHCADRPGGFSGQVMEQGDLSRSYNRPDFFLCEQISTDEVGTLITPC